MVKLLQLLNGKYLFRYFCETSQIKPNSLSFDRILIILLQIKIIKNAIIVQMDLRVCW